MLNRIAISITILTLTAIACSAAPIQEARLSPAEADAIIKAREQAATDRKAARRAELEKAPVLSEGGGTLPNGQEVIVREVAPPENVGASLVTPAPPLASEPALTPEQLAQFEAWQTRSEKEQQVLMLSATVYDREVTRLSWRHNSEEFVAFANADFNNLCGVHSLQTDTHDFTFFFGIGDASRADNPYPTETIPPASAFSPGRSEYILAEGAPDDCEATAGIEALLAHYDARLPELTIEHQRRTALSDAKKRHDAKHPKEPEPFILQFWVPEKSGGEDSSPRPQPRDGSAP